MISQLLNQFSKIKHSGNLIKFLPLSQVRLKSSLVVVLMMFGFCAFSQKDTSQIRDSRDDCFGVVKYSDDYVISINGVDFKDKDKAFICKNDLPASFEVRYTESQNMVDGIEWDWSDCECDPIDPPGPNAEIAMMNFKDGDKLKISFTFKENKEDMPNYGNNVSLKMSVELIDKIKVNINKSHLLGQFSFDETNIEPYPFYEKNIASKFLPAGGLDQVFVKHHKNYLDLIDFSYSRPITQIDESITEKEVELAHFGQLAVDSTFMLGCEADTLLDINVYPEITKPAKLYLLCESDDDYANYCVDMNGNGIPYEAGDVDGSLTSDCMTPIDSLTSPEDFECINPGLDGSLDRYRDVESTGWWRNKDNDPHKPSDRLTFDPKAFHKLAVFPMQDDSGSYHCNKRPKTLPGDWNTDVDGDGTEDAYVYDCPSGINAEHLINDINTLYSQVGVQFDFEVIGPIGRNYDSKESQKLTSTEQLWFHISELGEDADDIVKSDELIVWMVKDMKGIRGRATGDDEKLLNTLMINSTLMVERTVSHEIGHAAFELYHPDGSPCKPPESDEGWEKDNLDGPYTNDKYNFMNSGCLYQDDTVKKIDEYRIRKYQWKKIRISF